MIGEYDPQHAENFLRANFALHLQIKLNKRAYNFCQIEDTTPKYLAFNVWQYSTLT